jgi:hypothetical protein
MEMVTRINRVGDHRLRLEKKMSRIGGPDFKTRMYRIRDQR